MDVPEIEEFLNSHADDLIKLTEVEANNWGLVGDVEDSEIFDISVNDINTEIITAFKPVSEGDHYLAICKLKVKANVQFTHPDWDTAMYDSEDKVLLAFEQVSGETQVEFEVDASISISGDENGDPQEIKALSFRNSGFQYVELHPYDPYDYK